MPGLLIDPLGLNVRDACLDAFDDCLARVDKRQNACLKRATDTWVANLKQCRNQPEPFKTTCELAADALYQAMSRACFARFDPLFSKCRNAYEACLDGQRAREQVQCFTVAVCVTYGIYRVCRAIACIKLAPLTGGCSLVGVVAP